MKKKLCRIIFRKELEKEYQKLQDCHNAEMYEVLCELDESRRQHEVLGSVFKKFSDARIVGIEKNKREEELLVVMRGKDIYLFGERYQGNKPLPRLYYKIVPARDNEFEYIYIQDVQAVDANIGNGSIILKTLVEYAKECGARKIVGNLSIADADNADRRNHYYEKFGFKVSESRIELDLME